LLVIAQLAERDTQLGGPTGIRPVDIRSSFPNGVPAKVDVQLIRYDQIRLWSMIPLKNNGHVFSFGNMSGMDSVPKPRGIEFCRV